MQHFPNQSQFALGFISGDSQSFAGVLRRHDSLVYIQNKDMAFEIGSISKTFTAAILAKLIDDGLVNADEPIKNILPVHLHQSAMNGTEVTVLHLSNHTSGFPKEPGNLNEDLSVPGSPYQSYDQSKLYDFLTTGLVLQSEPGTMRSYSNLGGGLLGHLVELIGGKSYELLLDEYICQPLNLQNTFIKIDSSNQKIIVPGRDSFGRITPNWELNVLSGGGGIKSTASDLARYLRAQLTDTTYFYKTQQPTFQYTEHNFAGLGWSWYKDGEYNYVDATGGTGGYSCIVIFERTSQKAIILLSNVSAFLASRDNYITQTGIDLHRSLSSQPPADFLSGFVRAGQPIPDPPVNQLLDSHHVPAVSIAVVHTGKIDWAKAYGFRQSGKIGGANPATLFQAASISKPVSAVVALRLVQSAVLTLDEDINKRLTSWKIPHNQFTESRPITLRRLLSHSAGLNMHGVPEFATDDKIPTLIEILDGSWQKSAPAVQPVFAPGTQFRYSGGGYIILQVLLSDITGRPFTELARDYVLNPAGMEESTFEQPLPTALTGNAAVGHDRDGAPIKGLWHILPEQAAGGLWTTPTDLALFMIALWKSYQGQSKPILNRNLAREMLSRQIDEFGLGLSLPRAGVFRFQHSGGNTGYRCFMVLSVTNPEGVVIMTNGDNGEDVIWEIFEAIAEAYGWQH